MRPWPILLLALLAVVVLAPGRSSAQPTYVGSFGSYGTGAGEFLAPVGVAVDADDIIYVADIDHDCIKRYTRSLEYLGKWTVESPRSIALDTDGTVFVASGNGVSSFTKEGVLLANWTLNATGIAVDRDHFVYVNVANTSRVRKFTSNGTLVTEWNLPGEYATSDGIATDRDGNVYVADVGFRRVVKFTGSGAYLTQWGILGSGAGQFLYPVRLAMDVNDDLLVVDHLNHRVTAFTREGGYRYDWGTRGSGAYQFDHPIGIAVSRDGVIYVADKNNIRISMYASPTTRAEPVTWGQLKARFR
jgi:sugar lactone lactonase YvrE